MRIDPACLQLHEPQRRAGTSVGGARFENRGPVGGDGAERLRVGTVAAGDGVWFWSTLPCGGGKSFLSSSLVLSVGLSADFSPGGFPTMKLPPYLVGVPSLKTSIVPTTAFGGRDQMKVFL